MGRPSDCHRSARRLGKRERARVKKHRRAHMSVYVPGAGIVTLKAGRKKWTEACGSYNPANPFGLARLVSADPSNR